MIEIIGVTKSYDRIPAVDQVDLTIKDGEIFGLIGTNGAGKSTLLRMMSGVMRPDKGQIRIDQEPVFGNVSAKEKLFFIADDPFFFANASSLDMAKYYSRIYADFDMPEFLDRLEKFGLDSRRKISTFSKGMKKQLSILLALAAKTKYIFCDETFDGLDPVMRQGVKSLFAREMDERGLTPVIASHNLRELEDICDHVGLIHKGGVLLSKDLAEMKLNIQKLQCVLKEGVSEEEAFGGMTILKLEKRGSLYTATVRASGEEVNAKFAKIDTVFFETLPLSLEEIFISETEVVGYDIKNLILG